MLERILDGIDTFLDRLESVEVWPLALAVLCHLLKLACTSMAWRNVLAAAYPAERVRWLPIYGSYLAGVAVNAIVPARGGDAVRIVLAHRAVPGSTYTTVVSSTLVLAIFDVVVATLFFGWALGAGALPGLQTLATRDTFDFAWLFARPILFELLVAGLLIALVALGFWVRGHVASFWARVGQGFRVLRPPRRYLGRVAVWQAADWLLRLASIWFFLDAFDIPQSLQNVSLVQVSQSAATLMPITPAGIGTEQALLLYVLAGAAPTSVLLAFSVGAKLTMTITNAIVGFTAIVVMLGTVRYSRALRGREGGGS